MTACTIEAPGVDTMNEFARWWESHAAACFAAAGAVAVTPIYDAMYRPLGERSPFDFAAAATEFLAEIPLERGRGLAEGRKVRLGLARAHPGPDAASHATRTRADAAGALGEARPRAGQGGRARRRGAAPLYSRVRKRFAFKATQQWRTQAAARRISSTPIAPGEQTPMSRACRPFPIAPLR